MKKLLNIVVTLCALALAVAFWMLGGAKWLQMKAGPETIGEGETFAQAEGKYIEYEAAYPVATRVEEYYSGDPERVRTTGYVVYDAKQQTFIYIIVSENDTRGLGSLMWNLKLTTEMRAKKDMSPGEVEGTLKRMEPEVAQAALEALEDSELVSLYNSIQRSEGNSKAYLGDEYGEAMAAMCKALETGIEQTEWYYIECGSIDGMGTGDIVICILAAGLSFLIFLFRLIGLFTGDKKTASSHKVSDSASKLDQFFAAQWDWVTDWCDYNMRRGRKLGYLSLLGSVVIFLAIGVLVKVPVQKLLVFYLSLGVLLGEIVGLMFWFGQKSQSKPAKIMKKLRKSIGKELPSAAEQEYFAEDILNAGGEWSFQEKTKESWQQGVVGSRYWVSLLWNGRATVIDSERLDRIETATISGSVRSGKVRVHYLSYAVRFYYKNATPKKFCDKALSFEIESAMDDFMALVKKRVGDTIKITAE